MSLNVSAATTAILGGNVTTSGTQSYGGNLILNNNVALTSNTNNVTIVGDITSSFTSSSASLIEFLGDGAWKMSTNGGSSWISNSGLSSISYNSTSGSYTFAPNAIGSLSYLVVGGGGGGGIGCTCFNGGGGGGGGAVGSCSFALINTNSLSITIGAGGSGATVSNFNGIPGMASILSSATGGLNVIANGGLGGVYSTAANGSGGVGGTSAGASVNSTGGVGGTGGLNSYGLSGANGTQTSIIASQTSYFGGGGGGGSGYLGGDNSRTGGSGGLGGGGAGATPANKTPDITAAGIPGGVNTGGGGGGSYSTGGGGAGGSGIIILSLLPNQTQNQYALTIAASSGTVSIGTSASNSISNLTSLSINSSSTSSVISSAITGSTSLVKTGTGTLSLSGANSFTGGATISAGSLSAKSTTALGNGAVTIGPSGILDLALADTLNIGSLSMCSGAAIMNSTNNSGLFVWGVSTIAGSITTGGNQNYLGGLTLAADTNVVSNSAGINFASTIDGAYNLATSAPSFISLGGAVGKSFPLSSLTLTSGSIQISGGSVATTGSQTFSGPVSIQADTSSGAVTLASNTTFTTSNAALSFGSTVDGAFSLTTATGTGAVSFGADVGKNSPLSSLTIGGTAATTLSGNVTTTGAQSYGGNLVLAGNSAINLQTNNATITVSGNISSPAGTSYSYLTGGATYTTNQNGSNPYQINNISLSQNWTFQGDYWIHFLDSQGTNTIFNYGSYADGILVRTANRGDSLYLKGNNYGAISLFGTSPTAGTAGYQTVKITYTTVNNVGTMNVYAAGNLIAAMHSTSPLNPAINSILIGSAFHNSGEGLDATIKNIFISSGGSALTLSSGSAASIITGGVSNTSLSISSTSASSLVNGVISGTASLTKSGATGVLTLNSANTYSGTTTISGGTLKLAANASIGSSSSVIDNGILDISAATGATAGTIASLSGTGSVFLGSNSLTLAAANGSSGGSFSGVISGAGGLILSSGTEILSGANTYSGGTYINGGTLQVASSSNLDAMNALVSDPLGTGKINFAGGVLQYGAGITTDYSSRLNMGQAWSIDTNGQSINFASVLADSITTSSQSGTSLTKSSLRVTDTSLAQGGKLVLSAANTYSGGTYINGGMVQAAVSSSLGTDNLVLSDSFGSGLINCNTVLVI